MATEQAQPADPPPDRAASPPLPTRHTAATPGPKAARFQELFASSLQHTLARVSADNFAACYPTVAAHASGALQAVRKATLDRLEELCMREFDSIMQTRTVVPKLNELESLFSDAARRREEGAKAGETPIPPHLLPAEHIMAAHLAPHLAAQQATLQAKLQTVQARNAALYADVAAQRAEAEALLVVLEGAVRDVEGAGGLLESVADELVGEARAAEAQMAEI